MVEAAFFAGLNDTFLLKKENEQMAKKKELNLEDFTDVTNCIDMALEKMNTIFKSLDLTEEQKTELRRLGVSLHNTGHDLGHFFLGLELPPSKLKQALQKYYAH